MSKRNTLRMYVECSHAECKYRWVPDPRKWTNHLNKGRVLTCPMCRKPMKVTPALEKQILKWNDVINEFWWRYPIVKDVESTPHKRS